MIGLDLNRSKLLIPKFGISLEMFEREKESLRDRTGGVARR